MVMVEKIKQDEPIAAISTPAGEGGVGMIRLSGDGVLLMATEIFRDSTGRRREKFEPRRVHYGFIVDTDGSRIDEVFLTALTSPKTYTREDMVEITCHGGALVVKKILNRALRLGARLATPGEFSKRAFLNGRIDLLQAEAIIDIIRSRSEKGWKTAFSQLDGRLSERLAEIENELVAIMADIEASIDFPDEELEIADDDKINGRLEKLKAHIQKMVDTYDLGRIYREGVSVVIVGRPNVGKSSLMNALLERDRVIVTPIPGTTRDTVEEHLQLEGIAVKIVDTAGVREASDLAERFGVERALSAAREADVAVVMFDGSESLAPEDVQLIDKMSVMSSESGVKIVAVINKKDVAQVIGADSVRAPLKKEPLYISAKTGAGVDDLRKKLVSVIEEKGETFGDGPVLTRERHLELLRKMTVSIDSAMAASKSKMSREFIAADLQEAKESLEELTGKAFDAQVLEKIFSEFCIGK